MNCSIDFQSQPWKSINDHAREKQVIVGGNRLRLLQLDAGFQEQDWCCKVHYGYVIEGNLQIQFEGNAENLSAGDGIALSVGDSLAHRAVVLKGPVTLFLVEPVSS